MGDAGRAMPVAGVGGNGKGGAAVHPGGPLGMPAYGSGGFMDAALATGALASAMGVPAAQDYSAIFDSYMRQFSAPQATPGGVGTVPHGVESLFSAQDAALALASQPTPASPAPASPARAAPSRGGAGGNNWRAPYRGSRRG